MALTQEEQKLKEANSKLTDRVSELTKQIEKTQESQKIQEKAFENVGKKDIEKRKEIQRELSNIERDLKDLNLQKTFTQISVNLETSLSKAVKVAGTSLVKSEEEIKRQTATRILELSKNEKGRQKAFELLRESIDNNIIQGVFDLGNMLGKEGENFIKTFQTFEKNVSDLERQQVNLRRQGLAFEVDALNNRLIPIRESVIKEEQRRFANLEKETEENDRELKILVNRNDLTQVQLERIDTLTKRQEEIIDLQQEIKDKGIQIRRGYEKSIFIPQKLTDAFNDFFENQRQFLGGKSIRERTGDLGEFFDAITPAPIQDLFRTLITSVSPVIQTFKELLKPFKLIPFVGMKIFNLFKKNEKALETHTDAVKEETKTVQDSVATNKKSLKTKKEETKEVNKRESLFKKVGKVFSSIKGLLLGLPLILISLVALAGVFLLFKKTIMDIGRKFGIFGPEEKSDSQLRKEAYDEKVGSTQGERLGAINPFADDIDKKAIAEVVEEKVEQEMAGATLRDKNIAKRKEKKRIEKLTETEEGRRELEEEFKDTEFADVIKQQILSAEKADLIRKQLPISHTLKRQTTSLNILNRQIEQQKMAMEETQAQQLLRGSYQPMKGEGGRGFFQEKRDELVRKQQENLNRLIQERSELQAKMAPGIREQAMNTNAINTINNNSTIVSNTKSNGTDTNIVMEHLVSGGNLNPVLSNK